MFLYNIYRIYNSQLFKQILPTVLELIETSPRYHRTHCPDINLLIIGVPNVGKSSLINSLRRNHIKRGSEYKLLNIL